MTSNYRHIPMAYYDSIADARKTLRENSLISLELQLQLLEWLERRASVPAYQQFMTTYGHRKIDDEGTRQMLGEFLHRQVKDVAASGSAHYVSANMCEVIKHAAVDMPASGLKPSDLTTDTGWLTFEHPIPLFMGTTEVRISAIAWQVGTIRRAPLSDDPTGAGNASQGTLVPGVTYYLFQTAHDAAVVKNLMEESAGSEERVTEEEMRRLNGPLTIFDFSGWAYSTPWNSVPDEEMAGWADEEGVQYCHPIVDQARRLLLATWRMFRQKKIVHRDINGPTRILRKRGHRVGYEPENGDIVIIRMRTEVYRGLQQKTKEAGEGDDTSWYRCQFLVRGHWHGYWTGPRAHCDEHNLVDVPDSDDLICTKCGRTLTENYLLPYPKGNPNGPLVLKDQIFGLER